MPARRKHWRLLNFVHALAAAAPADQIPGNHSCNRTFAMTIARASEHLPATAGPAWRRLATEPMQSARIAEVETFLRDLQDRLCAALEGADGGARFREDA